MAVTTTTSSGGTIISYTGTLQEVIDAVESAGVNAFRHAQFFHNGTNYTAVTLSR